MAARQSYEADQSPTVDRSHWQVRIGSLSDRTLETSQATSPEERLAMVWPLTVQAWAFRGVDIAESRLPRHRLCITRRKR
jgi:hypothetical protein